MGKRFQNDWGDTNIPTELKTKTCLKTICQISVIVQGYLPHIVFEKYQFIARLLYFIKALEVLVNLALKRHLLGK